MAEWVFANQQPTIVNDAYEDSRFNRKVDKTTGFQTRNLIGASILDARRNYLGTLQSLNKQKGDFSSDDL